MQNIANAVSIDEAEFLIHASISKAFKSKKIAPNICLSGSPGTAKSSIIFQIAKRLEKELGKPVEVIDLRLAAIEESVVQGIPFVAETGEIGRSFRQAANDEEGGYVEYKMRDMFFSTPAYFPRDPNKFYILFLDELMNAPLPVQHAAYRLILDRTCQNGTKLPDSCAIVAAGNLKEDKTGAKPLAPAAANRFAMHLVIDRNRAKDAFIRYAMQHDFDESIVGYLNYRSENVYQPPSNGESAFPTQRSWEFANEHLKNEDIAENNHFLTVAVAGAIGSPVAIDFMGFRENYDKLPDWKKVRAGKTKYEVPRNDEQLKFAISTALAFQLIDAMKISDGDTSEVDNLCEIVDQVPNECKVVMFKTMRSADAKIAMKFLKFPSLKTQWEPISTLLKKNQR